MTLRVFCVLLLMLGFVSSAQAEPVCKNPTLGRECTFTGYDFSISLQPVKVDVTASCRGIDNHLYVFVENSIWDSGYITQEQVDVLKQNFDHGTPADDTNGIYQLVQGVFLYQPPDVFDNDDHIYVVIHNIVSTGEDAVRAYFREIDLNTDGHGGMLPETNGHEIIFLDRHDIDSDERLSDLAGALVDMIHWGKDPLEALWVRDVISRWTALHMGYSSFRHAITSFSQNPSQSLLGDTIGDTIKINHGPTTLFGIYLDENMGTTFFEFWLGSLLSGREGFEESLAILNIDGSFCEFFQDWVIRNGLNRGNYSYESYEPPTFTKSFIRQHPGSANPTLSQYAGSYLDIDISAVSPGDTFEITYNIADSIGVRLTAVKLDSTRPAVLDVEELTLLSGQPTKFVFEDMGGEYDRMILVSSRCVAADPLVYTINTEIIPQAIDGDADATEGGEDETDLPLSDGDTDGAEMDEDAGPVDGDDTGPLDPIIYGDKSCSEINFCYGACENTPCREACVADGNEEGAGHWKEFNICINGQYPGGVDCLAQSGRAERLDCMQGQCPDLYEVCKIPETVDGETDSDGSGCTLTSLRFGKAQLTLLLIFVSLMVFRRKKGFRNA